MKKFDISGLVISNICDIYSYRLARDTEGGAKLSHSVLIIRKSGASEYTVGSKKYIASPDTVLYLAAGVDYTMYVTSPGDCIIVEFDTVNNSSHIDAFEFSTQGNDDIFSLGLNIIHFWKLKGPAYRSKCLSELYTLITQISTVSSSAQSLAGKYRLIHKSVKYIESNYRRIDLYTPMLAKMSGVGETYYRSIFISVFSIPPAKYIQNYRIEKAKELLVNSTGSIEQIATATGFANSSYFCKVFTQTTGITPTEFAEKGRHLG